MPLVLLVACDSGDDSAESKRRTIAFLRPVPTANQTFLIDELGGEGFVVGRNLEVLAPEPDDVHPDLEDAAETVRQWRGEGVDLIVAFSSGVARVAVENAPGVEILFLTIDPGLVSDEDQPAGRLTGVVLRTPADRTLSIAVRAIPDLRRVGFLYPGADPSADVHRSEVENAAEAQGLDFVAGTFESPQDIGTVTQQLAEQGVQALYVATSAPAIVALPQVAEAARAVHLPVISNTNFTEFAVVTLAPDSEDVYRQLGRQAGRLLSGTPPADVPVESPRRYRLVLNAREAEALGIELPADLLQEANQVVVD